jgi:hypothetical protein
MSRYYNRKGEEITGAEWGTSFENDGDQRRVAETTLPNGRWVSTVWLGLDHSFRHEGPPLIFESMVFPSKGDMSDMDCERYATEAEARQGHERLCAKWSVEEPVEAR